MKEAIYKAEVSTPIGIFLVAVRETEVFAKETICNLVQTDMKIGWGNFRIKTVTKSNRRILANMHPVKGAFSCDGVGQWGWIKKIK